MAREQEEEKGVTSDLLDYGSRCLRRKFHMSLGLDGLNLSLLVGVVSTVWLGETRGYQSLHKSEGSRLYGQGGRREVDLWEEERRRKSIDRQACHSSAHLLPLPLF